MEDDRISLLPDCLLIEIVSRLELSTKQVFRTTSLLSKRWQLLWTKLPDLLFIKDDDTIDDDIVFTDKYASFMDNTLAQYPSDNLQKFKLHVTRVPHCGRGRSQVNKWIDFALKHNVQEIDLRITGSFSFNSFFFTNSCVTSMKLSGCSFKPNGAIRWDKLKYLCIHKGGFSEDTIRKIVSGSPCLDTLELNDLRLLGRLQKSLFGNLILVERLSCSMKTYRSFRYDTYEYEEYQLYLDSYPMSMKLSRCAFPPPNGDIGWDKLKCLCICEGKLDEDSIAEIFSGSPCLETLELKNCSLSGRIRKSMFGNFGVVEHLFCDFKTYERFSCDDELFLDDAYHVGMKLSCCVSNSPDGAIRWDKLNLCIFPADLTEDSIEKIISENPSLETLKLSVCSGFRRIDVTSKSVKHLEIDCYYCCRLPEEDDYIDTQTINAPHILPTVEDYTDTLTINAPHILSLKLEEDMDLRKLLLENVSSLVKVNLNYRVRHQYAEDLGLNRNHIEEELLQGLLSSLGHVNEIALCKTLARGSVLY